MSARGVNKVILIGNLGQDPDSRTMPNGNMITRISLATSDSWKDRNTGEAQERTEWHRVVFFGKLAEIAAQYLKKGSKVYVEGRLQTRKWQDQQGQDRYTTEVVVDGFQGNMQMLDARGSGGTGDFDQGYGQSRPSPSPAPAPQYGGGSAPAPQRGGGAPSGPVDQGFDDDIPF